MEETNNKKEFDNKLKKGIDYISNLSEERRERILKLLNDVQKVHKSELNSLGKRTEIKRIMWSDQSARSKLFIGGFLGSIVGLFIFGTGGIGIAGLGGAIGIWGFLAGTTGGLLVSSLIQNFEKK